jgi:hypothetical protein
MVMHATRAGRGEMAGIEALSVRPEKAETAAKANMVSLGSEGQISQKFFRWSAAKCFLPL